MHFCLVDLPYNTRSHSLFGELSTVHILDLHRIALDEVSVGLSDS
jgi:hypothetical protein